MGVDSNTLGSAALTPQEARKIKKIEDATEAARNKLRNHHIYGVSLKIFNDFSFFYIKIYALSSLKRQMIYGFSCLIIITVSGIS